ncbi:HMG box-containing protein 4 [Denticeps clupeoides]|uniref:HMG box-containing protein 4 n=1 Tax=Denticeps clupeoides TaxID=299321 RepID=UPI0010A2D0A8|nr:HMG box-containing protein 4-like [Denticeps clupeoides]XP_028828960.1 HMG box-containing protein 4-like [Denticeps clupeoides]
MEGEVGLVAGRSQREKRRSYKDLLREEEEMDAEVLKSSKHRAKDSDECPVGGELHKKKRRPEDDYFYKDHNHGHSHSKKKKKKKKRSSDDERPPLSSPPPTTETAMGLLQAITSPLSTGSVPAPLHHRKPSDPQPSHAKERRKFEEQEVAAVNMMCQKKKQIESLPVVASEVELEEHYGAALGLLDEDGSFAGDQLEDRGRLIDQSCTQFPKKAKKSKKSKKKKDKKHNSRGEKHFYKGSHSYSFGSSNGSSGYLKCGSLNHSKKRKEEKIRGNEKAKKKGMTAYQLFCKEYRASINTELQGLDFGELSKKLADVWKQLPEGDKEVWKERAQYLQHKQQLKASSSKVDKSKASVKRADIRPELPVVNGASEEAEPPLSPVRVPEVDPINAAAHLQLLGESLSLIGYRLQETEGMVTVSGSLSVLLDSVLCALGPLACLTAQVPELNGCPQHVLSDTLDNIAHVMPGL